jgi:segregation and condensation protein B
MEQPEKGTTSDVISQLEAVLFWKGEAVSKKELAKLLSVPPEALESSLGELRTRLVGGVRLQEVHDEVSLVTAPDASALIEKLAKEELVRDLGKAGLETLAIVLYKGPSSRSDIDHIRGVNSQFILRNLLMRGLVERIPHPKDSRSFLYRATGDLLSHLGLTSLSELPEFDTLRTELAAAEKKTLDESADPAENAATSHDESSLQPDLTDDRPLGQ